MQSNTMVIDNSGSVDGLLEVSIPLVLIQLELQGFHEFILLGICNKLTDK